MINSTPLMEKKRIIILCRSEERKELLEKMKKGFETLGYLVWMAYTSTNLLEL